MFVATAGAISGTHAVAAVSTADQWRVVPSVYMAETYTNNVTLKPDNGAPHEFITQVTPGFTLNRQGARLKADVGYQMQNLFYAIDSDRNDTRHQLKANATAELMRDSVFLDARSSIGQRIVNAAGAISLDNLSVVNRTNVATYGVSPYAKLRFGDWGKADIRYDLDVADYGETVVSDSTTQTYTAALGSASPYGRVDWRVNYRNLRQDRDAGFDSKRESASVSLYYRLQPKLSLLGKGGYEHNDIRTNRNIKDGAYWSAGAAWKPSRRWALEATYGDRNKDAKLTFSPSVRTSLDIGYQNRVVGLTPGTTWSAGFSRRGPRGVTRFSYSEESSNVQTLQAAGQALYVRLDADGNVIVDPDTGLPLIFAVDVFALTDEEFLRKRAQASTQLKTARSNLAAALFHERREYELSREPEEAFGATLSWDWKLATRSQAVIDASWQQRDFSTSGREDKLWHVGAGLTRRLAARMTGALDYRHAARESTQADQEYSEDRVTVGVTLRF